MYFYLQKRHPLAPRLWALSTTRCQEKPGVDAEMSESVPGAEAGKQERGIIKQLSVNRIKKKTKRLNGH